MFGQQHSSAITVVERRFWAVSLAAVGLGPFLGWQSELPANVLTVAAGSLALVVFLTWFAEASNVKGWPVRLATLAAAASFSLALLPWSGAIVGWLLVLVFVAVAIEDGKPTTTAGSVETNQTEQESQLAAVDADEGLDEDVVSSQVRRIADGYECVEGVVLSEAAGPTHVVFHPPLKATPEIEIHAMDDCDARLAEATPYGFRVNTDGPGRIAFTAASPAA